MPRCATIVLSCPALALPAVADAAHPAEFAAPLPSAGVRPEPNR